jgi:hypothetical protein
MLLFLQVQTQAPPPAVRVVVGLVDGQQLLVENPKFSGFIETRGDDTVLLYRQENFHGNLSVKSISRVDFGEYKKGKPFQLTVTLRNGQKLEIQSEYKDYLMVQGRTDTGTVTIKHPDPLSSVTKLTTKKPNRQKDLKITYLEFPAL